MRRTQKSRRKIMKAWLRVAALEIEAFEVLIYIGGYPQMTTKRGNEDDDGSPVCFVDLR